MRPPEQVALRRRDLIAAGSCLALALLAWWQMTNIVNVVRGGDFGPELVPLVLIAGMIASAVAIVTLALTGHIDPTLEPSTSRTGIIRTVITIALVIAYLLTWKVMLVWFTTFVVCAALIALHGARTWKSILLFPAIISAVVHFLFVVSLRVPL